MFIWSAWLLPITTSTENVRNILDTGGGALMDLGGYCVVPGRYLFEAEPIQLVSLVDRDPNFRTDRLVSVIADFGGGRQLSLVCGTQTAGRQTVEAFGTDASLEIQIPFNAPADERTAILVGRGPQRDLYRREILPPVDQYTAQAEAFALAVLGDKSTLHGVGVEDAIKQCAFSTPSSAAKSPAPGKTSAAPRSSEGSKISIARVFPEVLFV